MSIAGRHGKLAGEAVGASEEDWTRVEDLLTADVFGALRLLPPQLVLVPALARAVDAGGQTFSDWLVARGVDLASVDRAAVHFWPALAGSEPDVFIALGSEADPELVSVLVEVKLHSGQHDIEGKSQIGYYADALSHGSLDVGEERHHLSRIRPLIFLTKAAGPPHEDLSTATREISIAEGIEAAVFWLGWRTILQEAERTWRGGDAFEPTQPWMRLVEDIILDIRHRRIRSSGALTHFPLPALDELSMLDAGRLPAVSRSRMSDGRTLPRFLEVECLPILSPPWLPSLGRRKSHA